MLNKRTIESLIKAGGFDSMVTPRQGLLTVFEQIVDTTIARRKEHDMGVMSLFGEMEEDPAFDRQVPSPTSSSTRSTGSRSERDARPLRMSDHPLLGAEADPSSRQVDCTSSGSATWTTAPAHGRRGHHRPAAQVDQKGDLMAVFRPRDLRGSVEVMVFPRPWPQIGHLLVGARW